MQWILCRTNETASNIIHDYDILLAK